MRRMDKGGQKREGLRVGKRGRVKREEVMGGEKAEWLWVGKGEGCEIGGKS